MAYADDVAVAYSEIWSDLPVIMAEFLRWAHTSGLHLDPSKCMLVPLWVFCDGDVRARLSGECPSLAACLADSSARYLGVEVGLGAWMRQWGGVGPKVIRRAAEIISFGEMLPKRLMQFRIYVATLPMYRAQCVDLDSHICGVFCQSLQRIMSAPW